VDLLQDGPRQTAEGVTCPNAAAAQVAASHQADVESMWVLGPGPSLPAPGTGQAPQRGAGASTTSALSPDTLQASAPDRREGSEASTGGMGETPEEFRREATWEGKPKATWEGKPKATWEGKPEAMWEGKPEAMWEGKPEATWEGKPEATWDGEPFREEQAGKPKGLGALVSGNEEEKWLQGGEGPEGSETDLSLEKLQGPEWFEAGKWKGQARGPGGTEGDMPGRGAQGGAEEGLEGLDTDSCGARNGGGEEGKTDGRVYVNGEGQASTMVTLPGELQEGSHPAGGASGGRPTRVLTSVKTGVGLRDLALELDRMLVRQGLRQSDEERRP
jgi:hypothetical protein